MHKHPFHTFSPILVPWRPSHSGWPHSTHEEISHAADGRDKSSRERFRSKEQVYGRCVRYEFFERQSGVGLESRLVAVTVLLLGRVWERVVRENPVYQWQW